MLNPEPIFGNMFDDRFGCPNLVTILKCKKCQHCFTTPTLNDESIGPLYEDYYGRSSDTQLGSRSSLSSRTKRWITGENNLGQFEVKRGSSLKLLDVGSGDCQNLWDARELGFDAFGFDVDSTSAAIAAKYGLKVVTGSSVSSAFPDQQFDWVQLNQVIEHFISPYEQLRSIGTRLSRDGRIFISTPNSRSVIRKLAGRKWINWHVPYHQHHFSKRSLRTFVETEGWEIVRMRTVTPMVWVAIQLRSLRFHPKLGTANDTWQRGSSRRGGRLLELIVLALLFIPIRVLDILRMGDCQVIVIQRQI